MFVSGYIASTVWNTALVIDQIAHALVCTQYIHNKSPKFVYNSTYLSFSM